MNDIEAALRWVADDWLFSIFVVDVERRLTAEQLMSSPLRPSEVRVYAMDPPPQISTEFTGIVEFDVYCSHLTSTVEGAIDAIAEEIDSSGSELFWFGFEGWFHFFDLLEPDGVYALRTSAGLATALTDDERRAPQWKAEISRASTELYEALESTMPGLSAARTLYKSKPSA